MFWIVVIVIALGIFFLIGLGSDNSSTNNSTNNIQSNKDIERWNKLSKEELDKWKNDMRNAYGGIHSDAMREFREYDWCDEIGAEPARLIKPENMIAMWEMPQISLDRSVDGSLNRYHEYNDYFTYMRACLDVYKKLGVSFPEPIDEYFEDYFRD